MTRFGAKRPRGTRDTLPVVVIACDDSKTAPAYFAELRGLMKGKCSIRVIPASRHGATGRQVIEYASHERSGLSDREGATVWAVIDLEMAHNSSVRVTELRLLAEKENIELALSQPCFEVWVLSHFIDTGELFDNCAAVLRQVKTHWKIEFNQEFAQKKANADYRKLVSKIQTATSHAKNRSADNSPSWTEIWRIVERLI